MKKLEYSTAIDATPEEVWHAMLDQDTYQQWTTPFGEGGHYEGGWNKGDKILFLGPEGETGSEGEGMVSEIAESRPHEFVSIRHLGIVKDGVEDTESEEARKWAPAYENYTFTSRDGGTLLDVSVETTEEAAEWMDNAWPKALAKLKEVAESSVART